jgi:hypothetical protein
MMLYRTRQSLSARHSLRVESAAVLTFYAAYEASRGLVVGDRPTALRNARAIASLEQRLHVFIEPTVQHAVRAVPDLAALLGGSYLTLHLSITAAVLLWLHRRRPVAFARVRTILLLASLFALVGFLVLPTAPPRLAAVGLADIVSSGHVDLNKGLISSLYNPYAAVPSLHMGYAIVAGAALARYAQTHLARAAGVAYPPFVLLVIVATGNHFLFDAAAGTIVVVAAYLLTTAISADEAGSSAIERVATVSAVPRVSAVPHPAVPPVADGPSSERLAA